MNRNRHQRKTRKGLKKGFATAISYLAQQRQRRDIKHLPKRKQGLPWGVSFYVWSWGDVSRDGGSINKQSFCKRPTRLSFTIKEGVGRVY